MKLYTLDNQFIEETDNWPSNFTGIVGYDDGATREWYLNGKLHREDGPAISHHFGYKQWAVNGKYHRLDGPACEYPNGIKEWWVDNKLVSEEQCKLLHSIMKLKGLI